MDDVFYFPTIVPRSTSCWVPTEAPPTVPSESNCADGEELVTLTLSSGDYGNEVNANVNGNQCIFSGTFDSSQCYTGTCCLEEGRHILNSGPGEWLPRLLGYDLWEVRGIWKKGEWAGIKSTPVLSLATRRRKWYWGQIWNKGESD